MKYTNDALDSIAAIVTKNANKWFNEMDDSTMDDVTKKFILADLDDAASVKMDEEAKELLASNQKMSTKCKYKSHQEEFVKHCNTQKYNPMEENIMINYIMVLKTKHSTGSL
eukprot:1944458-Ditylum_brightwellii.AAC.1